MVLMEANLHRRKGKLIFQGDHVTKYTGRILPPLPSLCSAWLAAQTFGQLGAQKINEFPGTRVAIYLATARSWWAGSIAKVMQRHRLPSIDWGILSQGEQLLLSALQSQVWMECWVILFDPARLDRRFGWLEIGIIWNRVIPIKV